MKEDHTMKMITATQLDEYTLWVTFSVTRENRTKKHTHSIMVPATCEADALLAGKQYCEQSEDWNHVATEIRHVNPFYGWFFLGAVKR